MEDKAKRYARIKYKLALVDIALTLILLFILQISGFAIWLKITLEKSLLNRPVLIAAYSVIIFLIYTIPTSAMDFYRSFVVEHRFGLSNQKFHFWLLDYLKSSILSLAVFIVLIETFFFFVRNFPFSWWWMSAIFWIFFNVVIARIFPILIIPLFFKYKRIEDESLRRRILSLAEKMHVKILDVFQIDFSKKSLKSNAAFVGLGKSKRVLLTDTLLTGKFLPEEIEAILAHEFAHYAFRHLIKMVILSSVIIVFTFSIFFQLSNTLINAQDISNLGMWLFLFMLSQIILSPFINWVSRIMERNADGAAIKTTGSREFFISMMNKLAEQNLSEKRPPLWAKILFYNHPTIEERVNFAKSMEV